jgi:hypothetical protein
LGVIKIFFEEGKELGANEEGYVVINYLCLQDLY